MKKKTYERPQIEVIEVDQTEIICTSPTGTDNEGYGTGDTTDWY